jgi:hypothetical protein
VILTKVKIHVTHANKKFGNFSQRSEKKKAQMKTTTAVFVFVVALLAGTTAARPDRRFVLKAREVNMQMARSPADAVQFLKGFAVGLETVLGDPAACAKDITNMTTDFNAAFQ